METLPVIKRREYKILILEEKLICNPSMYEYDIILKKTEEKDIFKVVKDRTGLFQKGATILGR